MKQYHFRLEPVLKLRKLKEEYCRTELGQLLTELNRIEGQLAHDRNEIQRYFQLQEGSLKSGMRAGQLQVFPMLVQGKERNVELLLKAKAEQERLIEAKKQELALLRGELKVMENLKDKDHQEWLRVRNKEIDQKVEEQTQNWLRHKDKGHL